jgi:hypothetical protein
MMMKKNSSAMKVLIEREIIEDMLMRRTEGDGDGAAVACDDDNDDDDDGQRIR